ncbi:MAG: HD domain-containing protein [Eubacteriales bacterium]|nr:HD domain-containing protein [Eubacteriales bacterium]
MDREQILLKNALLYEGGHRRRTEHILKVYGLTRLIAVSEKVSDSELAILSAAAILHDIPIKRCKEVYGDACQENQRSMAPEMVSGMMQEAGYEVQMVEPVLQLVLRHHRYDEEPSNRLRILMEADLLINYLEDMDRDKLEKRKGIFKSSSGRELLKTIAGIE